VGATCWRRADPRWARGKEGDPGHSREDLQREDLKLHEHLQGKPRSYAEVFRSLPGGNCSPEVSPSTTRRRVKFQNIPATVTFWRDDAPVGLLGWPTGSASAPAGLLCNVFRSSPRIVASIVWQKIMSESNVEIHRDASSVDGMGTSLHVVASFRGERCTNQQRLL
jgi:hypothetical protein